MEFPLVGFQGDVHHRGSAYSSDSYPLPHLVNEAFDSNVSLNRSSSDLEEHEIVTSTGIHQRVYVKPSPKKLALLTYHDIGTNHTSFLGFFNHPEMRVITRHFTVYHVCAPGHHEDAQNVSADDPLPDESLLEKMQIGQEQGSKDHSAQRSSLQENNLQYPSLDQLAQMLTSILVHFGIKYFVGFGMGAGSNVLARYALHHSDSLLGLFLLNPTATTHTYFQKYRCRWWDLPYLQQGYLTDNLLDQLDAHWFGYGLAENEDVQNFYHQLARSLNLFNLSGYIKAFMDRTALNLIRPVGPPMPDQSNTDTEPTVIETEVCLVTGDRAVDLSRVLAEMNGLMDPKRTQFLTIPDCTGMVMDENPDKLAIDFLHFLRSIGLVINLTPEKVRQQAIEMQKQQAALDMGSVPAKLDVDHEV